MEVEISTLILLGVFAFVVEKKYTSRLTIFVNAIVVAFIVGLEIFSMQTILHYWAIGLILAGGISIISYVTGFSLGPVNEIFYAVFGSKTVLGVLIGVALGYLILSFPLIIIFWYISIKYFGHEPPAI